LWPEAHVQVQRETEPTASDHFWKLERRKIAHSCGAKETVKMHKLVHAQITFGSSEVKSHAFVARSIFSSQDVENMRGMQHLQKFP